LGIFTCDFRSRLLQDSPAEKSHGECQNGRLGNTAFTPMNPSGHRAPGESFSENTMDINSIGSNYGLDAINTTQATAAQSASGATTTDSTKLSPMATLLNQLQQLQQTDPDKFKSAMSSIADTLKTDAQNATGPEAQHLNALADKFSQAAQTGQMPDLQPKGGPQGASGHHHHHHQVQSYQQGSNASTNGQNQPSFDLAQILQAALQQSSE
jgi:hypothetical protein